MAILTIDRCVLNSWKEVAQYVGRGVRTVQRWERDLGMPVHRPRARSRSAVVAFSDEIDQWLRATPAGEIPPSNGTSVKPDQGENQWSTVELLERFSQALSRNRQAISGVLHSVADLKQTRIASAATRKAMSTN